VCGRYIAFTSFIRFFDVRIALAHREDSSKARYPFAAESLGFSRAQAYLRIVLPLAFRISLPALNNNLVNLVKTTTLAYAIAVPEMLYVSSQIWSDELNVPVMMNVLLLCYLGLVGVLVWLMHRWERAIRLPGFGA
jgi:polar amino acid transport system permease protein